ncbi:hypothetical protein [Pontibacter vulgaris]|uniref:hypothetical protein n=1 Tax=Pontibacter vulgaris TaxID=2905679 RepID=UPI001FA70816|nr:hypothetical protein [Pontibacter vulgaris]
MKQLLLLAIILFASFTAFGQINVEDSTMQVIGYWDKNETQTYLITHQKYRISGADTTKREFTKYEVDVTIKDSTAKSYTIEWAYRGVQMDTDNQFTKKLAEISNNLKVIIKTNEMGAFEEVVNWKEIRDEIKRGTTHLRKEFKHLPGIDKTIDLVESMFTTKEAIEAGAIKDIQQFYTYHGAKYELGKEVNGKLQLTNLFGGKPFDTDVTISLDEIDVEENNAIIRMWQIVDSKQLTDATYAFLNKMAAGTGAKALKPGDLPPLQNETRTSARVHGSGWIIYSIETKEVTAENALAFEERIIEIK